jgi:HSP20 family protein
MPVISIPVKKTETGGPGPARRPFAGLWSAFHDEVDRLFDFVHSARTPGYRADAGPMVPALDIAEADTAYRISAELPGMSEKDVAVAISHDMLTVSGEKRDEHADSGAGYHLTERFYGAFQRCLRLPQGVDRDRIEATLAKGVLTITLPKRAEVVRQQKTIEVKAQ